MKNDFTGKVALVTGGSKGMGLAIAHHFHAHGADVAICSNEPDTISKAVNSATGPGAIKGFEANVANIGDMEKLVSQTVSEYGAIDILANCAGIQRYGSVVDTSEAVWDEVIDVNLKGIFLASKFAIPEIEKRGGGSIINIASVQAYASQSNVAAYTATKGAILALTRAMALDHADAGIRVNAICPASVDTPMLRWAADLWKGERTAGELIELWGKAHPLGRVGRPEEIASLAGFLASDACTFMTGADLKVDGGVLAKLGILLPE